jgi:hypothetical protein
MGVPLHTNYGEWVDPAQWAAMLAAGCIVAVALLRGNWIVPALWLCTTIALLPSSLFTDDFNPRWTYLATIPWCGFLAVVFAILTRWLARLHVLVAATALAAFLALLGSVFVPKGMELEGRLAPHASTMHAIERELQASCPFLRRGSRVLLFPIPVLDPGYAKPALVSLLYPGTRTLAVRPPMDPPGPFDCVLTSESLQVLAIPGAEYIAGPFWDALPMPPCAEAVDWSVAGTFAGGVIMVRGPIVAVHQVPDQGLTVLEVGQAGALTVVVRGDGYNALPQLASQGEDYVGSLICASGFVLKAGRLPPTISIESRRSFVIQGAPMVDP